MCLNLAMTLLLCQCDSVHRPSSKGSHAVRAADSDPKGRPGPTAAEPVQTANDKLGIGQGHWDSHFHVALQWLRRISSFKNNVQICLPIWRASQGLVKMNLNCMESQDTYQLLIVSHVLSSGHDLVTRWWVHGRPTSFNFKFWNLASTFSR